MFILETFFKTQSDQTEQFSNSDQTEPFSKFSRES